MLLIGKPSISMVIFHGYVANNQMVDHVTSQKKWVIRAARLGTVRIHKLQDGAKNSWPSWFITTMTIVYDTSNCI
jgi:hypothetical protein